MTQATQPVPETNPRRGRMLDVGIALALALVCIGVFANGLRGDFVYDDVRQIQQNRLIADPALLWQALTTDVWAFKGDRGTSWSNYWRPTFVLYLVLNHRLFGVENPFGWHVMSVLLHALVVGIGFGLLRTLCVTRALATAIALLFAVHPVHVESVTWISGSPDLLLAGGLLGALWCVIADHRRPRTGIKVAALALYAFAQLAKESAVLFPALVFVTVFALEAGVARPRIRRAFLASFPFALLAALYVFIHGKIAPTIEVSWDPGLGGMIRTAPLVLAFYLRQALFPVWIAPAYPLRVIEAGEAGWLNFTVPVAVIIVLGGVLLYAARRHAVRWIGVSLFVLPLIPAFYLRAFRQEETVHDRYLYLPLLGLLLCGVPPVAELITRKLPGLNPRWLATLVAGVATLLAFQTMRYNPTWCSAEALWTRAVEGAPNASHAWSELANAHYQRQRKATDPVERAAHMAEARRCADQAIALFPVTNAYLLRGMIARDERRFADAQADFELILTHHPEHVLAYENLAVCLDSANQPGAAIAVLQSARERVPHRHAAWTEKIAVCLYRLGKQEDVVRELEAARPYVEQEYRLVPEASYVIYRLALIRAARKEMALAREAADEFLRLTAGASETTLVRRREEIEKLRASLATAKESNKD